MLSDQVISLISLSYFLLVKPFYLALCLLRRTYFTLVTYLSTLIFQMPLSFFRYFKWLPSPFLWWPERKATTEHVTFCVPLCVFWLCIWKFWEYSVKFKLLTLCFHSKIKLSKWRRHFGEIGMNAIRKKDHKFVCVLKNWPSPAHFG